MTTASDRDALDALVEAGGEQLASGLAATEARLSQIAEGQGATLARHAGSTVHAGGKRLRPMLVFLCGEGVEPLVPAATAVELLHTATLVHDDVLDAASLRRGVPTVYATSGREAATTTGDMLFSRAFAELATTGSVPAVRALSDASTALARGELMQRADAWSLDVSVERYLDRCAHKTASLFTAACRMGAELGGGREQADALGEFGRKIGLAFQMLDDVLDVSGPAERTGKHRGTDLLDGTVTLPLILARATDPELRTMDLRTAVNGPGQAEAVCDRIALSGALGTIREYALGHVAEAKAALTDLGLTDARREALELVADGVVERYA